MDIKREKILYVTKRKDWRSWLQKNHNKEKEVWLVYYRKSSCKPRIPYNDAVEEALCFGWIDSIFKRMNKEKFVQRFTPRKKGSNLSEMNKERVRRLIKQKKMTSIGLKAIQHTFDPSKDKNTKFILSKDIILALKKDSLVWENFQKFSEGYKKVRIGYLESQRKHSKDAFKRSLDYLIKRTAKNKKFGMIQ